MKRKISLILTLLLVLTLTLSCSTGIATDTYKDMEVLELHPVNRSIGKLQISVDPRIELLSAVQLADDYFRLTKLNFDYKVEMNDYFKGFQSHDAVKKFKQLSKRGFTYDGPPAAMLYYENPLSLREALKPSDYIYQRASGEKNLTDFIIKLKAFGIEASFADFYNSHQEFYQGLVDEMYSFLEKADLTADLDDYYNMEVNSYNLILAPLFHSGGYGPRVMRENGVYDIYGIIGPLEVRSGDDSSIGTPQFIDDSFIRNLIWHEFSHSFVNPTTEKYIDEINKYKGLFSEIENVMKQQAYTTWESCVNEHIVRAVTTRLAYLNLGEDAGDEALSYERSKGFIYIDALVDSLEYYEKNRDIYPDFESYYPELIEVFSMLSDGKIGSKGFDFTGPINSAFIWLEKEAIVVITPTNEIDKDIGRAIADYAKTIKEEFFAEGKLVTDIEALDMDLKDHSIITYGTVEGNLWLAEHKENLPFKIEADAIEADRLYEDTNMVYISALPNPYNPNNGMVIYTAQRAVDIVGINSVFHGPTDYVITKDGAELKSGNYVKERSNWSFR